MSNGLKPLCSLLQEAFQLCLKFFAALSIMCSKIDSAQRKFCAAFSVFTKLKNYAVTLIQALWNGILLPLRYSLGATWILVANIVLKISHILFHVPWTLLVRPQQTNVEVKAKRMQ